MEENFYELSQGLLINLLFRQLADSCTCRSSLAGGTTKQSA